MKIINVSITFAGTATVAVPDHLSENDAKLLAQKLACSRAVASCDNPDAPDEDACEEYAIECSEPARATAEKDFDASEVQLGVCGVWTNGDDEEDEEEAGDDLCDLCHTSGVHADRTTPCGKTIGIECGCEKSHHDGTCGDPDCEECKKAKKTRPIQPWWPGKKQPRKQEGS